MPIFNGTVIASQRIPEGSTGVLRWWGIAITNPIRWDGTTTFQLRINGHPYRDYASMTVQLGTIANPTPVSIPVYANDLIEIVILDGTNISSGESVTARLKGWFFPTKNRGM